MNVIIAVTLMTKDAFVIVLIKGMKSIVSSLSLTLGIELPT